MGFCLNVMLRGSVGLLGSIATCLMVATGFRTTSPPETTGAVPAIIEFVSPRRWPSSNRPSKPGRADTVFVKTAAVTSSAPLSAPSSPPFGGAPDLVTGIWCLRKYF